GLEVPLLTRIMERHYALKVNLSNVLSMDYLGALLATLAFPFLLLPFLGVFRSAVLAGLVNMSVGFLNLWYFADRLPLRRRRVLWGATIAVTLVLGTTLALARGLLFAWSNDIYGDRVLLREQTPYQNIVLTRYQHDLRLYLNGNLQFSSLDEYRYHEALVHIPAGLVTGAMDVLVLGGGDGLAVRELLKYNRVRHITLVDLDPAMLRLARNNPHLLRLNQDALGASRVRLVSEDAFVFLRSSNHRYDLIIADLPDPNTVSLARLYSREFYRLVRYHLSPGGVFVTQATSPFYATAAFWTIASTLQAAGFQAVRPYHAYVPSFGDWGFVMATDRPLRAEALQVDVPTRFLREGFTESLFRFGADTLAERTHTVSTIDSPTVLTQYLAGWQYWN
ncbi:MAG: polyamine aminopropyltransferase, partial [Nitrococcus sp.]|nr:polyamine aminopropyltransferase [Nitrococcus sp.]